jgi:hypothetical protein
MKILEIAKNLTLFLIGLTFIIAIVKLMENNLKLSIYEILVLILLFSIAIGIHYIILYLEEIDLKSIVKTINNISTKGLLGSLGSLIK